MKHNVVGYGSLMNHKSLKKTVKDRDFQIIQIKGYKRIFNLYSQRGNSILNVTPDEKSSFNAVLMEVTTEELKKIKDRENHYSLKKINTQKGKAYISVGKNEFSDCMKKPNKKYFEICRDGAHKISKEFGKTWDATTYTSNNQKISSWIKSNPSYDDIK